MRSIRHASPPIQRPRYSHRKGSRFTSSSHHRGAGVRGVGLASDIKLLGIVAALVSSPDGVDAGMLGFKYRHRMPGLVAEHVVGTPAIHWSSIVATKATGRMTPSVCHPRKRDHPAATSASAVITRPLGFRPSRFRRNPYSMLPMETRGKRSESRVSRRISSTAEL